MSNKRPHLDTITKQYQEAKPSQVVYLNYIRESIELADMSDTDYIAAAIKLDTICMKGQIGYELPIKVILCDTNTTDIIAVLTIVDRSELTSNVGMVC